MALPSEPTPARLYGNPKVHKPAREDLGIPPLREIVSCSGSNTEGLGKLIDSVTRPVDEGCSSFLEDTPHLLRLYSSCCPERTSHMGVPQDSVCYAAQKTVLIFADTTFL